MTPEEWEALCDGCGKCCLNKLEDEDTGEVAFTRVACRLLDGETCRCTQYDIRRQFVPECVRALAHDPAQDRLLAAENLRLQAACTKAGSCHDWHPLISGDPQSVHLAGASVQGWTVPEFEVPEEEWEDYIIEETP